MAASSGFYRCSNSLSHCDFGGAYCVGGNLAYAAAGAADDRVFAGAWAGWGSFVHATAACTVVRSGLSDDGRNAPTQEAAFNLALVLSWLCCRYFRLPCVSFNVLAMDLYESLCEESARGRPDGLCRGRWR